MIQQQDTKTDALGALELQRLRAVVAGQEEELFERSASVHVVKAETVPWWQRTGSGLPVTCFSTQLLDR
jgi:hypothetical protein